MSLKVLPKLKLERLPKKPLLMMLLCITAINATFASAFVAPAINVLRFADITVTGRVTDEQQQPLPGVSVSISSTKVGTVTDVNGNYRLTYSRGLRRQDPELLICKLYHSGDPRCVKAK